MVIFLTGSNTFNKSSSIDPNQLKTFPNLQTSKEVPVDNPDNRGGNVAGVNSDSSYGPSLSKIAKPTASPTVTHMPTSSPTPSPAESPTPTPSPSDSPSPSPTDSPAPSP